MLAAQKGVSGRNKTLRTIQLTDKIKEEAALWAKVGFL